MSSNPFALLGGNDEESNDHGRQQESKASKKSDAPSKRTKDRHDSGTGRRDKEKRGGKGKYNWGEPGSEGRGGRDRDGDDRRNNNADEEESDGADKIDLDTYLATRQSTMAKVSKPKQRKAGEGEDASQWGNTVAISGPGVTKPGLIEETEGGKAPKARPGKKQAKKNLVPANQVFRIQAGGSSDTQAPRERRPARDGDRERRDGGAPRGDREGGRGGRGGGRGGARGGERRERGERGGERRERGERGGGRGGSSGGRGAPRGGRSGGRVPDIANADAFPTLG